jgi:hypothetical protein
VVLDQDVFTVPTNDIPKTKVLMTMLGGKVVHLMPGLAGEIGLTAAGAATWPSKPLENRFVFKGPPKACPAFIPDGFPGRVPG